jgi:phosphoribosylformylglycinamidine synthase
VHLALRALIYSGSIKSAHDCSEGGLAVALAECCISRQLARETPQLIGADIDLTRLTTAATQPEGGEAPPQSTPAPRLDALLFGETQSRFIISTGRLDAVKVVERAKLLGIPAVRIGTVGGDFLIVNTGAGEISWPVAELHDFWWNSVGRAMKE